MAIVQISRITNRKGLQENLPQLAGAEFGYCVDTRRLFIGNGTLQEGAPTVGNTEILTEYSDLTDLLDYTYADVVVGYAAQTGPNANEPVVRSVQAKLDDMASVRDFGAVGDGIADDTAAINNALYQLYCRESNPQIRRSLFFPAGTYRVTETIIIPTYAKLVGEGAESSFIILDANVDISSLTAYVARLGDSQQQTGANIGTNGAQPPQDIEISSMTFQSFVDTDVFLVDRARNIWFSNVYFVGNIGLPEIENNSVTPVPELDCVVFNSGTELVCTGIVFDRCIFANNAYAFEIEDNTKGVVVSNSYFQVLLQGCDVNNASTGGVRILHSIFDNIFRQGIVYRNSLNVSAFNVFYNVGYSIGSPSPTTPVISFENDLNVSTGDLFERSDADAYNVPRITITQSSAVTGGQENQLGRYNRAAGRTFSIANNVSNQTIFSVKNDNIKAFKLFYTITRDTANRTGTLMVVSGPDDSTNPVAFTDDFVENQDVGVTLTCTQVSSQVNVLYTSNNSGFVGTMTYSMSHLA